ncbi:MAG: DNA-directed RNA polymerase subunit omega, partial [Youngiibacter sp.]|nr:DNA-directed RNA polymerase subunit omega [Youngiibacter sp.]
MIEPSVTELLEKVDNRYRLVTVTARRARQILDGSPLLTEFDSN